MSRSKRKPNYRLPLHLVHIAAGLLTTLFLLLEGVSGPGAGYWWIDVKYSNGESWHLGGLGACKVGEKCTFGLHAPAHYSQVHGALSWHIAAGSIFFNLALANTLLIYFPPPLSYRGQAHWTTFLMPPLLLLLPLLCLITTMLVRQAIVTAADVVDVKTNVSFWL